MGSFRFFTVLSAAVLALALPLVVRDAVTVENDITQKIAPQATTLANAVNGFPASGLAGALGIHTDATGLVTTVNSATTDTKAAGAFSEANAETILGDVQSLTPTILNTLTAIVAKKANFTSLPIGGIPALVLSDLQSLNTSVVSFASALIADAPASLVPNATTLKNTVASAFATAIAAYS